MKEMATIENIEAVGTQTQRSHETQQKKMHVTNSKRVAYHQKSEKNIKKTLITSNPSADI